MIFRFSRKIDFLENFAKSKKMEKVRKPEKCKTSIFRENQKNRNTLKIKKSGKIDFRQKRRFSKNPDFLKSEIFAKIVEIYEKRELRKMRKGGAMAF